MYIFTIVGLILLAVLLVVYGRILIQQYDFARSSPQTLRFVILSLRCALVSPMMGLMFGACILWPNVFDILLIPESIVEGYILFCMFSMLVLYVGGPEKIPDIIKNSKHTLACFSFINSHPDRFYLLLYYSQLQILFFRPLLTSASVILSYYHYSLWSVIISGISILSVLGGILMLLKFYLIIYDCCRGLNATKKITVIKVTIALIVFEQIIESCLYTFGVINMNGSLVNYDQKQKFSYGYSLAILIELTFLSLLLHQSFSYDIDTSKAPIANITEENSSGDFGADFDFAGFLIHLIRFWDIFRPVRPVNGRDQLPLFQRNISISRFYRETGGEFF